MRRREFLIGAAGVFGAASMPTRAQTPSRDPAKLGRMAIMSLCFNSVLKNANFAGSPQRTLDLMDIGQVYADKWGVHNVELQHTHLPSTEEAWLKDFKARLAKTRSQVTNINLEFGPMNISAANYEQRVQAIDLTKQWIGHAVTLGCPRVMVNQGQPTPENKANAIAALKAMGDYGKTKGVKVAMENRGAVPAPPQPPEGGVPPTPPPLPPPGRSGALPFHELLVEIIKGSGTYANCDIGNFPNQQFQHAGMRLMFPMTDGNAHVKLLSDRFDLPAALKLTKELGYTGLYSIEANANYGPDKGSDPYQSVQKIYDVILGSI